MARWRGNLPDLLDMRQPVSRDLGPSIRFQLAPATRRSQCSLPQHVSGPCTANASSRAWHERSRPSRTAPTRGQLYDALRRTPHSLLPTARASGPRHVERRAEKCGHRPGLTMSAAIQLMWAPVVRTERQQRSLGDRGDPRRSPRPARLFARILPTPDRASSTRRGPGAVPAARTAPTRGRTLP
jgi:hypothetical protein